MVEDTATRLMKVPLAPGGLRLLHRVGERLDVLDQLVGRERRLADAGLHDAGLLDAELDRAALGALHRAGRRPWSRCRPSGSASCRAGRAPCRAGRPAASGRAWRCSGRNRSCRPAPSRPDPRRRPRRRRRPWPRRPWRRARTRRPARVRPEPFGRLTTPRTIWSAWRGSTPRFIAISMVSSNFALARSLTIFTASSIG